MEDFVRPAAPLTVDREKGIIYGVKVLGWNSDNSRRYLRGSRSQRCRVEIFEAYNVGTEGLMGKGEATP